METVWKKVRSKVSDVNMYEVSNQGDTRYTRPDGVVFTRLAKDAPCDLVWFDEEHFARYPFIYYNGAIHIHVLVARAFIKNPNKYKYIRHKDGRVWNNKDDNLEWVQTKEEMLLGVERMGRGDGD